MHEIYGIIVGASIARPLKFAFFTNLNGYANEIPTTAPARSTLDCVQDDPLACINICGEHRSSSQALNVAKTLARRRWLGTCILEKNSALLKTTNNCRSFL